MQGQLNRVKTVIFGFLKSIWISQVIQSRSYDVNFLHTSYCTAVRVHTFRRLRMKLS